MTSEDHWTQLGRPLPKALLPLGAAAASRLPARRMRAALRSGVPTA